MLDLARLIRNGWMPDLREAGAEIQCTPIRILRISSKNNAYRNILWIKRFYGIQKFKLDFLIKLAVLENKILNASRSCFNVPQRQT